jgi:hypothetical protein
MKLFSHLALAGLALAGVATLTSNAPRGDSAANYKFSTPPVNGLGVRSIADLRGKPILIDFWGHN